MQTVSSKLNPNVVQTALDKVFYQNFQTSNKSGRVDATNAMVFNQDRMDSGAEVMEIFEGTGLWNERAEEQAYAMKAPRIGNTITFVPTEFAKNIPISRWYFDDDKHSTVSRMVRDAAITGRITRDTNAFNLFNNAFTTTLTADGAALCSDSHTTLNGDTVDNKLTAALTESALYTAITALEKQKAQDGTIRGNSAQVLVVPTELFKTAIEITSSEFKVGEGSTTSFNDGNFYSMKYGLQVVTSPYLTSATAWFLLAENHSITRWVRDAVSTDIVDYKYSPNDTYQYKMHFREVVGAPDYAGIVGSDGTS